MRRRIHASKILLFGLMLGLSGCFADNQLVVMRDIQQAVQTENYERAEQLAQEKAALKQARNDALRALELGMITHLSGKYADSNAWFELAVKRMDELDVISVSGTAEAWILSEKFQPYRGEDFERVLAHYYMALNYLLSGELQDALVECRRVNELLQQFDSRYEQKSVYKADAFVLYLSGLIYEAMGETNDAFIDYRHAFETYQTDYATHYGTPAPVELQKNLLRTAAALGFHDEGEKYRALLPDGQWPDQQVYRESARLVVIWENGLIPYKAARAFRWDAGLEDVVEDIGDDRDDDDDDDCYVKFSFAEFVPRMKMLSQASVTAGGVTRSLELAEDLARIAAKNLEDRRLRTMMQAMSRNLLKCAAQQELGEKHWFWQLLLAGFTELTEGADVRHWFLLPADIHITQLLLPPGDTDVVLSYADANGKTLRQATLENVHLEAGRTKFVVQRTF